MKPNIHKAVLFLLMLNSGWALEYPYSDFIGDVSKTALSQSRNASTWSGGATSTTPSGGQIVRFWCDIDSDGKDDLFLMSSVNFPYASIYKKTNNASGFEKVTNAAVILNFYLLERRLSNDVTITTIYQIRGYARIAKNSFENHKRFRTDVETIEGASANSIKFVDYGERISPKFLQRISMQELVLSDYPNWREADASIGLLAQNYDVPKLVIPEGQTFTPSFVLQKLGIVQTRGCPTDR